MLDLFWDENVLYLTIFRPEINACILSLASELKTGNVV